jgi:DNA (cytosine-5)-methyltransferase 1
MRYVLLCDGVGAAHLAFRPLGWKCLAVAETDKPCEAVLDRHWGFPNVGDITSSSFVKRVLRYGQPDLIIGGTPCQPFSTCGKRRGLQSPQGQVTQRFFDVVGEIRPRWVIWENVTGVLSCHRGEDFAVLVDTLEHFGYGWAYRTLDAQYFGVPQRRRRVFLVGYLGHYSIAAKVLFDTESVPWRVTSRGSCYRPCVFEKTVSRVSETGGIIEQCLSASVVSTLRTGITVGLDDDNLVIEKCNGEESVRRLTPIECERLQGLPDDYTRVSFRGKCPMADYHRYRMIGNAMAVPVVRAIGKSVDSVYRYLHAV